MAPTNKNEEKGAIVGIVMGSNSDWEIMKHAADKLEKFGISHECKVISAHRTPKLAIEYAENAESRGLKMIIAGAGCAAHLAGVVAANTALPVLGVPLASGALNGIDALYSTVQMPAGVPVATFAIGKAGAINAALCAVSILALGDLSLKEKLFTFRQKQTEKAMAQELK